MTSVISFALVTVVLLGTLYWLSHRIADNRTSSDLTQALSAEDIIPQHYKYFPQVRQALSGEDQLYLARRANPRTARMARTARRTIALDFLRGLRSDYRSLDRLARALTTLAPTADRQRETERLWFTVKFEFVWRLVWLRLWTGATPVMQIEHLSELIGTLASRLEKTMSALHELPTTQPT